MAKKTPEQKEAERLRYITAIGASNYYELEQFLSDPNQAIRAVAASNPDADEQILDLFANDKFWGVRIEVINNANVSNATLFKLLEPKANKRGVVHHAARKKLESLGVKFNDDGMPSD
ncbi:TPA: hypothetical protein P1K35_002112 [Providencia rettgeri]|uniref:hypothetical protein n=1 Tax=Providencia rettgeri TaxID=587 RepID=UPI00235EB1E2|nr:hypothetical protein [Providencia rettgeri]